MSTFRSQLRSHGSYPISNFPSSFPRRRESSPKPRRRRHESFPRCRAYSLDSRRSLSSGSPQARPVGGIDDRGKAVRGMAVRNDATALPIESGQSHVTPGNGLLADRVMKPQRRKGAKLRIKRNHNLRGLPAALHWLTILAPLRLGGSILFRWKTIRHRNKGRKLSIVFPKSPTPTQFSEHHR
jgi:hypothetical protein